MRIQTNEYSPLTRMKMSKKFKNIENDEEVEAAVPNTDAPAERAIVRRISSKQRRLSLDKYCATYLQVPGIADRKPVFVSREVRDRLGRIVRCLGGRGMSVSGLVENIARQHLAAYGNDIDQWRKLLGIKTDQGECL